MNFGFAPIEAKYFAAADLSICDPKLEQMNVPEGVEEFFKQCFFGAGLETVFLLANMKISPEQEGKFTVNPPSGEDFAILRVEQGELKALRIPNFEIIWLDGTKLWF
jgi:hypothetical protein